MSNVKLKATELDVYVDGKRVGWVTDCGGFWRIGILGRRKRRAYNVDCDTKADAVRAIVSAVQR
jgi:hypothetical protein